MRDKKAWAVVYVWRGLPDRVELFSREDVAWERVWELRDRMPQEDEISVFEVSLPRELANAYEHA